MSQTPALHLCVSPSPFAAADNTSSTPAMLRLSGKGAPFSGEDGGGGDISMWGGAGHEKEQRCEGRAGAVVPGEERAGAVVPGRRREWFPGWDARPAGGHSDMSGPNFFSGRPQIQTLGLGLGAPAGDALSPGYPSVRKLLRSSPDAHPLFGLHPVPVRFVLCPACPHPGHGGGQNPS
jgi:hypothetical protein